MFFLVDYKDLDTTENYLKTVNYTFNHYGIFAVGTNENGSFSTRVHPNGTRLSPDLINILLTSRYLTRDCSVD